MVQGATAHAHGLRGNAKSGSDAIGPEQGEMKEKEKKRIAAIRVVPRHRLSGAPVRSPFFRGRLFFPCLMISCVRFPEIDIASPDWLSRVGSEINGAFFFF